MTEYDAALQSQLEQDAEAFWIAHKRDLTLLAQELASRLPEKGYTDLGFELDDDWMSVVVGGVINGVRNVVRVWVHQSYWDSQGQKLDYPILQFLAYAENEYASGQKHFVNSVEELWQLIGSLWEKGEI